MKNISNYTTYCYWFPQGRPNGLMTIQSYHHQHVRARHHSEDLEKLDELTHQGTCQPFSVEVFPDQLRQHGQKYHHQVRDGQVQNKAIHARQCADTRVQTSIITHPYQNESSTENSNDNQYVQRNKSNRFVVCDVVDVCTIGFGWRRRSFVYARSDVADRCQVARKVAKVSRHRKHCSLLH